MVDLIDSRSPTSREDFMHVLEIAFHETLHGIPVSTCMQTGPTTGVEFPRDIGFPQSEIHADVVARIESIAAGISDPLVDSRADYAKYVADLYLEDLGTYEFRHQLGEMVSFVLTAEWGWTMTDAFGLEYLGHGDITNEHSLCIKMHQTYRYLARAQTMPAVWAEIRSHGLPEIVAQYWHVAAATWTLETDSRVRPHEFFWDLMFGPDIDALVAYTDGAAGTGVPPRPT